MVPYPDDTTTNTEWVTRSKVLIRRKFPPHPTDDAYHVIYIAQKFSSVKNRNANGTMLTTLRHFKSTLGPAEKTTLHYSSILISRQCFEHGSTHRCSMALNGIQDVTFPWHASK